MGTSQPKPDAPPRSPLIPPWADRDPPPPPPPEEKPEPDEQRGDSVPRPASGLETSLSSGVAEPRRYSGFRSSLRRFAKSGDRSEARTALGRWVRTSSGGAAAGSQKVARAARTGGAALVGLARAGAGQPPEAGRFDIRSLAGQPIEVAIAAIVDEFLSPGILDEMAARLAMEEALASALGGVDTFDPLAVDANALQIATSAFLAELVFLEVAGDAGQSLASMGPELAAQRESDIRSLVREVVSLVATPLLESQPSILNSAQMSGLIERLVLETRNEMAKW
jgi:hypothetical protein